MSLVPTTVLTRVELASGREVRLSVLHMAATYGGLIEGYPMAWLNDRIVADTTRKAGDLYKNTPVHVVTPIRTQPDVKRQPSMRLGPVELLPPVICTGLFTSNPVSAADDDDAIWIQSRLVIVWFQDNATTPNGREAPAALREVPWEDHAKDGEP